LAERNAVAQPFMQARRAMGAVLSRHSYLQASLAIRAVAMQLLFCGPQPAVQGNAHALLCSETIAPRLRTAIENPRLFMQILQ
jgi:hypothetical protein